MMTKKDVGTFVLTWCLLMGVGLAAVWQIRFGAGWDIAPDLRPVGQSQWSHARLVGQSILNPASPLLYFLPLAPDASGDDAFTAHIDFLKEASPPTSLEQAQARRLMTVTLQSHAIRAGFVFCIPPHLWEACRENGYYVLARPTETAGAHRITQWSDGSPTGGTIERLSLDPSGQARNQSLPGRLMIETGKPPGTRSALYRAWQQPFGFLTVIGAALLMMLIALWIVHGQPHAPPGTPDRARPLAVVAAIAILAIAAVAFFWRSEQLPSGYFMDSVATSISAACVSDLGKDEHGMPLPVVAFKSLGDYKAPLFTYILAIAGKMVGHSLLTSRRIGMILGFIGVLVLSSLVSYWRHGKTFSPSQSIPAALFLLSPWMMVPHRIAHEPALCVFMVAVLFGATFAVLRRPHELKYGVLLGVVWGLQPYAYHATKFVYLLQFLLLPAAVAVTHGIENRQWPRMKGVYLSVLIGIAMGTPLLIDMMTAQHSIVRYLEIKQSGAFSIIANYFRHMTPDFWFFNGDANLRHHTGYRGMLNLAMLPLIVIGGGRLCHNAIKRKTGFSLYVVLFFVAAPIPAGITSEGIPHALRTLILLPPIFIMTGLGIDTLLSGLSATRWSRLPLAIVGIVVVLGACEATSNWRHFNRIALNASPSLYTYIHPPTEADHARFRTAYGNRSVESLNYRYFQIVENGDTRFCNDAPLP